MDKEQQRYRSKDRALGSSTCNNVTRKVTRLCYLFVFIQNPLGLVIFMLLPGTDVDEVA